ncbi:DUF5325 family protein [Aquibacillus kalidii]|uniref:DUF5325 family protein n=1 Tax=Aquibacillus kalidii TaxID=2762597 RepID=UPI00164591C2|nr:DUF5325 family protein [Aquibacillus kalidii]
MKIQYFKLLLALLVIASFASVGISIAYRSVGFAIFSFVLGFLFMGYGLTLKRKEKASGIENIPSSH